MSNIGKDTNLDTQKMERMKQATLNLFLNYFQRQKDVHPWYDVGAGESYMRNELGSTEYPILFTDIDLDANPLPFEDESMRTVTSFDVLEHLYNPLFHLKELHRVMKTDAILYLVTPNDYSLIYKAEHLLSRKYPPHFHQFSEGDLRNIMGEAGFNIRLLIKYRRGGSGTIARISRNVFFVIAEKRRSK